MLPMRQLLSENSSKMTDNARERLSKAASHFDGCHAELEELRKGYIRSAELVGKMVHILYDMENARSTISEKYIGALEKINEAKDDLDSARSLAWAMPHTSRINPAEFRMSLIRAQGYANGLREDLTDLCQVIGMDIITAQAEEISSYQNVFTQAGEEIGQAGQYFSNAARTCTDYIEHL